MPEFGLIGKKLTHSFSGTYFTEKFERESLVNHYYRLFELQDISFFPDLIRNNKPAGLNVTIPYKKEIINYLDEIDSLAKRIGAVNVIKTGEKLTGYNTDYFGFRESLENWLPPVSSLKALVLGTGGAASAVTTVLTDLKIPYMSVSRSNRGELRYEEIDREIINTSKLIINTTPLGMSPEVSQSPSLPYEFMDKRHFLYDLVYNPEETLFMKKGKERGCQVKNGLEMLYIQAEKAWEIWNK